MNRSSEIKHTFTKFTSHNKEIGKSYDVNDGQLIKETQGSFYNGSFKTIYLEKSEIKQFVERLEPWDILIQGVNPRQKEGQCPDDARRLKEDFPFPTGPGFLMLDSDNLDEFTGISNLEELVIALDKIEPALKKVMKFCTTSASSNICFRDSHSGVRGIHTYIPIDHAIDNPRVLEILHKKSVLAGYAYGKITKDGNILIRSLIDLAMKTPNQSIFEGGAILKNDEIKQVQQSQLFEGECLVGASIKPLTQDELLNFDRVVAQIIQEHQVEADLVRASFVAERAKVLTNKGAKPRIATKVQMDAVLQTRLHGQFIIKLSTGSETTVQDILNNKDRYHLCECFDPLDDTIAGKSIIYSNQSVPVIHSFAHGEKNFYLLPNMEMWALELDEFVMDFNEHHASVLFGGKHKIMREGISHKAEELEFLGLEEMKKLYSNEKIQVGVDNKCDPILKNKIAAWIDDPRCRKYVGGVVFEPAEEVGKEFFNLWQGFSVEPHASEMSPEAQAGLKLIKSHIETVVCHDDPVQYNYFYDWVAYSIQKPKSPARSALVLRGKKGSGKGVLGHFLKSLWGVHGLHISSPLHLTGRFNGHLARVCFLFADEAFFSGDRKNEGVLKSLITEPELMLEQKGIDAVRQPNYLKIFMATNKEYAVPASSDERRYAVFDVSEEKLGDKIYFDRLNQVIQDGDVRGLFFTEMLERDLTDYSPSRIPQTDGLKDQIFNSFSSKQSWLYESLDQGYFLIDDFGQLNKQWYRDLTSEALYKSYLSWCNANHVDHYDFSTKSTLGKYLTKFFLPQKIKGDRCYLIPPLEATRKAFEDVEKVSFTTVKDAICNGGELGVLKFMGNRDKAANNSVFSVCA